MGLDDGLDDDPLADLRLAFPDQMDAVLAEWLRLFRVPGGARTGTVTSYSAEHQSALIDLDNETGGLLITTNPGMDPTVGDRVVVMLLIPQGPALAMMAPENA